MLYEVITVPTRQLVQRMGFGERWPQEAEAVVGESLLFSESYNFV